MECGAGVGRRGVFVEVLRTLLGNEVEPQGETEREWPLRSSPPRYPMVDVITSLGGRSLAESAGRVKMSRGHAFAFVVLMKSWIG